MFFPQHGIATICMCLSCEDSERGRGFGPPSRISHQKLGFFSNTGPDPPPPPPKKKKITKLPSWCSVFVHHRPAGEMPFNWCFAGVIWRFPGGPMMARFKCYLENTQKRERKRNGDRWTVRRTDRRMDIKHRFLNGVYTIVPRTF